MLVINLQTLLLLEKNSLRIKSKWLYNLSIARNVSIGYSIIFKLSNCHGICWILYLNLYTSGAYMYADHAFLNFGCLDLTF